MNEPDFNPEDEAQVNERLRHESIRPDAIFAGKPLWPFTNGSKGLYEMILSEEDSRIYRALAFVFVHIRRTEASMEADLALHVTPLVFGPINLFRTHIMVAFRNTLSGEDVAAAFDILRSEMEAKDLSEFIASPPDLPEPQKKSTATRLQKKRGTPTKRRKS